MSAQVSVAEAAQLVGRHERIIRGRIKRGDFPSAHKDARGAWRLDADDLERIVTWRIDRERLATLESGQRRTPGGLVARVELLERQLRDLAARVRLLEGSVSDAPRPASYDLPNATPPDVHQAGASDLPATLTPFQPSNGVATVSDAHRAISARRAGLPPLPDGLVSAESFANAHGIPRETWQKARQVGRLRTVEGEWRVGRALTRHALDAEGRRVFFSLWGERPDFRRCSDCPHA